MKTTMTNELPDEIMENGIHYTLVSDYLERLRKIVTTWDSLSAQMAQRNITREVLMTDEFAQWAVTTPLYNIGEQVYQLTRGLKAKYPEQP